MESPKGLPMEGFLDYQKEKNKKKKTERNNILFGYFLIMLPKDHEKFILAWSLILSKGSMGSQNSHAKLLSRVKQSTDIFTSFVKFSVSALSQW